MGEIGEAFARLSDPVYWVVVLIAALLAGATGLIPGFSGVLVMALAIPFITDNVTDPGIGLVALATITGINNGLDTIPAILLGQPGSGNNVSFLEGHQLARQGKAAHTLGAVYSVSAMGGIIGGLVLVAIIPFIRAFVLKFSFPELAMLALFGVAMVSGLSSGAMRRGLASGLLGILFGTVGLAPATSDERFIFDRLELWEGLPLVAVTLGLFALPEMIDLTLTRKAVAPPGSDVSMREVFRGTRDGFKYWPVVIRQSIFGVILGAIPGIGQATIDWLSYAFGIFWTKDKSQFGKGSLLGVVFAESAQNSKESGQAIPTLALGVPGGLSWALILVAMLDYNIAPGPQLLGTRADILILMVITLSIGNLLMMIMGIGFTGQLAKLTLVPYPMVGAVIIPIVFVTGFIAMYSWLALPIMFAFMGIGLVMKMYQWPRPPMLIGLILGPIIESNMVSAISVLGWRDLLLRPLTVALFLIAVGTMWFFSRSSKAKQERELPTPAGGAGEPPDARGESRIPEPAPENQQIELTYTQALFQPWNIPVLLAVACAAVFIYAAFGYAQAARWFPMGAGIGILVFSLSQLYSNVFTNRSFKKADIMDIGMKSIGMEGATQAMWSLLAMFAVFILVSGFAGLQWGTVSWAVLSPFLLMEGKWKYIGPVLAVVLVGIFEYFIVEEFVNPPWPTAALWSWFTGLF